MIIRVPFATALSAELRRRRVAWRMTAAASASRRGLRLVAGASLVSVALLGSSVGNPSTASANVDPTAIEEMRMPPLPGPVLRSFERPPEPWLAGHRGVDLAGTPGEAVRAAANGVVTFAGQVAGVGVVSVEHGRGLRTTYQPVTAAVTVGTLVPVGDVLGSLMPGHCPTHTCLHWGLRNDTDYLDPMTWVRKAAGRIRLLPTWAVVTSPNPPSERGGGSLAGGWPTDGPVTSTYGYRTDPITGQRQFHDGVDIGAPCGAPVRAPQAGTVSWVGGQAGFGNRVEIDHDQLAGGWVSSYSHLADASLGLVRVGERVSVGQVIGVVGSTGRSTGCHLHFSAAVNGVTVDPAALLA